MACTNCDKCTWGTIKDACRVCVLNDKDTTIKAVCYCTLCGAYICENHWGWNTPLARAEAVVKNTLEKTVEIVEQFVRKKRKPKEITDEFGQEDESKAKPDAEIPT